MHAKSPFNGGGCTQEFGVLPEGFPGSLVHGSWKVSEDPRAVMTVPNSWHGMWNSPLLVGAPRIVVG